MRPDYHSIFLLSGPGVKPGKLGTIEMLTLKERLETAMGITCPERPEARRLTPLGPR